MINRKMASIIMFAMAGLCVAGAVTNERMKSGFANHAKTLVPALLSDINIPQYVSLPVLQSITIEEAEIAGYKDAEKEALNSVVNMADKLQYVDRACTALIDYTVSKDNEFLDRQYDFLYYVPMDKNLMDGRLMEAFHGKGTGEMFSVMSVKFLDYQNADVQITIKELYDMPYPLTDQYMAKHTEYASFAAMASAIREEHDKEKRDHTRTSTVNSLLATAIDRTTFVSIPDSLVQEEYKALNNNSGENSYTYEDARKNLRKIFFIAAAIEEYDIASSQALDVRADNYIRTNGIQASDYERERLRYLLYEDEVTNYIYKNVRLVKSTGEEASPDPLEIDFEDPDSATIESSTYFDNYINDLTL